VLRLLGKLGSNNAPKLFDVLPKDDRFARKLSFNWLQWRVLKCICNSVMPVQPHSTNSTRPIL
jgi:hypothetical protein